MKLNLRLLTAFAGLATLVGCEPKPIAQHKCEDNIAYDTEGNRFVIPGINVPMVHFCGNTFYPPPTP